MTENRELEIRKEIEEHTQRIKEHKEQIKKLVDELDTLWITASELRKKATKSVIESLCYVDLAEKLSEDTEKKLKSKFDWKFANVSNMSKTVVEDGTFLMRGIEMSNGYRTHMFIRSDKQRIAFDGNYTIVFVLRILEESDVQYTFKRYPLQFKSKWKTIKL